MATDTLENQAVENDSASALSRDAIIVRALELADEHGLEALSIRRIASSFDKSPMALYRYIDSMDDIKLGMASLLLKEVDTSPVPGERWDDTLRRTMSSIRASYMRHVRARIYSIEAPPWSPAFVEHNEKILRLHRNQGIPEEVLAPLWRVVESYLLGFVADESFALLSRCEKKQEDELSVKVTQEAASDKAFLEGIDIIVAGVRALAAPDLCDWRTPE